MPLAQPVYEYARYFSTLRRDTGFLFDDGGQDHRFLPGLEIGSDLRARDPTSPAPSARPSTRAMRLRTVTRSVPLRVADRSPAAVRAFRRHDRGNRTAKMHGAVFRRATTSWLLRPSGTVTDRWIDLMGGQLVQDLRCGTTCGGKAIFTGGEPAVPRNRTARRAQKTRASATSPFRLQHRADGGFRLVPGSMITGRPAFQRWMQADDRS